MLDGKIARKYGLVTDFGKFMDPLADKFMVIGAMMILLYRYESIRPVFIWAAILVIFRELAVTSMRLVVSGSSGIVVAANMLGKIKTVTQIVCVCTVILEPLIYTLPFMSFLPVWWVDALPLTYLSIVVMAVFTAWSGIHYLAAYWKYLDPQK
jgi:CDP-diacylglycerol--glycerol-3-phosphate 3-phosphatidyltransferase